MFGAVGVEAGLRTRLVAAALAVLAAFLWATYYLFVLAVSPGTRPSAVLFYPFLGAAVAFLLWGAARGRAGRLLSTFAEPASYVRLALLLGMQASVLAATYLTGPVDAALLSLLGDVVATPLVVAGIYRTHRGELRTPLVLGGLLLSVAGGTLAIAGGHRLAAVGASGWLVVGAVPVTVAFFFVLTARAARYAPVPIVVGQSMVGAAICAALLAPLLPGGLAGIASIRPEPLVLLVTNGLASFFLAQLLYFLAIERAGLVFPPMLMTGIPVFTLLLSAAVLGIPPALLGVLGVPVAAAGGVLALAGGRRASARPEREPSVSPSR